ncbi:hypothetical protein [Pseudomonas sp. UMAB-08]|uniref:hypothetical protein n=1 Tax=Pseudomonas sp. UMAB-08 TaxID=1365375 RepID=UPI001C56ABD5|nr:hypothetical protein [Pseudomonas sp. UMAB-08]
MSTEVENSFLATLTYEAGLDARNNPINVPIDFSYTTLVSDTNTSAVNSAGDVSAHFENIPDQYLYANVLAENPVLLYFRYIESTGFYNIWVRDGKQFGKSIAKSNNGYIYADSGGKRVGDFNLIRKGQKITLGDIEGDSEASIHLQLIAGGSGVNLELYNRITPDPHAPDRWYAYVVDKGFGNAHLTLHISKRNVDYINP